MHSETLIKNWETFNEKKLPTRKEVCWRCHGEGTHDCFDGGFSPSDEWVDDDFIDDYLGGMYSTRCTECDGNNVIDVVDEEMLSAEDLADWNEWLKSEAEMRAVYRMERAMGA